MANKKFCFLVASPMTASAFLSGHIRTLCKDYEVHLVCNLEAGNVLNDLEPSAKIASIEIHRKLSPVQDLKALIRLYRHFSNNRYDIICTVTPKAGLLGMLAGFLSRVPCRLHIFTGQVWVTRSGLTRWLFKSADKLIAMLATNLLTDSDSQRKFLIDQHITDPSNVQVIGGGSICGVDTQRFRPCEGRSELRLNLGIPDGHVVLLFLGRMSRDKGLLDLARAFARFAKGQDSVWLLLVGPDEEDIEKKINAICAPVQHRVKFVGFTSEPEKFMTASDIFVLPSYREGFGSAVIEAAACGLPSVCSRIYGLTDAVVDGVTGLLHNPADPDDIECQIEKLVTDQEMRLRLGAAARLRAVDEFSQDLLTSSFKAYVDALESNE